MVATSGRAIPAITGDDSREHFGEFFIILAEFKILVGKYWLNRITDFTILTDYKNQNPGWLRLWNYCKPRFGYFQHEKKLQILLNPHPVVRQGRRDRPLRREPPRLHGALAGDEQARRRHGPHQHAHQGQLAGAHPRRSQGQGSHVHDRDGKK